MKKLTNKWTELFKSVSTNLIQVYEKQAGVNFESEIQRISSLERKESYIGSITSVILMGMFAMVFLALVERWFKSPLVFIFSMAGMLLMLCILIIVFALWKEKNDKAKSESLGKLEAFEKVVNELDPADLNPKPIRSSWVLDEKDIKENLVKLARKVLFIQANLEFLKSCRYAVCFDVGNMDTEERKLNERLTSCIKHLKLLGIEYSRTSIIADAKKLAGVVDEQKYTTVMGYQICHSHGEMYYISGEAYFGDNQPPDGSPTHVYLHKDGIWRTGATTPNPKDPKNPHQTGYYGKEEAEQFLRELKNSQQGT